MNLRGNRFQSIDIALTRWMASRGLLLLRLSIGIIYLWFGMLKFFDGMSQAQDFAIRTIRAMTFQVVPDHFIIL